MSDFDLDEEILAFLQRSASFYPDDTVTMPIDEQRRVYGLLCQAYHYPYPHGVVATDTRVPDHDRTVALRQYQPADVVSKDTAILYCHGGGFILGDLESHDAICAELCANTRLPLVAVDYSLAPEFTHPVQLEDVRAAFLQVKKNYSRVVVAGDSAGATLVASLCAAMRLDTNQPDGQLLIYPSLGGDQLQADSYRENAHAPGLTTEDIAYYRAIRVTGEVPFDDPTYYPLASPDFSGLPPCVAFSADIDPLRDDARLYVDNLMAAGVSAVSYNHAGLVHGYLRARHVSEKAATAFALISTELSRLANASELVVTH